MVKVKKRKVQKISKYYDKEYIIGLIRAVINRQIDIIKYLKELDVVSAAQVADKLITTLEFDLKEQEKRNG